MAEMMRSFERPLEVFNVMVITTTTTTTAFSFGNQTKEEVNLRQLFGAGKSVACLNVKDKAIKVNFAVSRQEREGGEVEVGAWSCERFLEG